MLSQKYSIIVDLPNFSTVITGGEDPVPAAPANESTSTTESESGESSITISESDMRSVTTAVQEKAAQAPTMLFYIGIYALLFLGLYFLFIRPNRKKEKNMREMQSALKVGDNVITSAGFYGVISAVGDDCFVIEFGTNKGIRIPVRKFDVIGVKAPNIQPSKEVKEVKEVKETNEAKPVKENKWLKNPMASKPNAETKDAPAEIMSTSSEFIETTDMKTTDMNTSEISNEIADEHQIKEKIDN